MLFLSLIITNACVSKIKQCLSFCDSLMSLKVMTSNFIYDFPNGKIFLFFKAEHNSVVCAYHVFLYWGKQRALSARSCCLLSVKKSNTSSRWLCGEEVSSQRLVWPGHAGSLSGPCLTLTALVWLFPTLSEPPDTLGRQIALAEHLSARWHLTGWSLGSASRSSLRVTPALPILLGSA
jgi:hypothetical protein